MKKLLLLLLVVSTLRAEQHRFSNPSEITYEWLSTANDVTGGTNHVVCFREILQHVKLKTVLEFGLGYGTKYYLDNCKRVLSIEVITHGYGPERLKSFLPFYKDYSNWVPIAYFSGFHGDMSWAPYKYMGTDSVYRACSYHDEQRTKHYKDIDGHYIKELNEFLTNLSKYNKIDVAVVHPMLYLRGDLVQILFNKVPIIIAQNTSSRTTGHENAFGYGRVVTPENYEEIYLPLLLVSNEVPGTTVWVMKKPEHEILIEHLKQFAKTL
jgi:hypothetical protein